MSSPSAHVVPLLADIGVPMIFLTLPLMACALVPVIFVEVWVGKPMLQTSYRRSTWVFAVANVVSTIIGIPAAWALMLLLELGTGPILGRLFPSSAAPSLLEKAAFVILGSPWLGPAGSDLFWMVPLAAMILLVPSFFASWYIEALIIDQMVEAEWPTVFSASFKANLASYALLFVGGCGWLIFSIVTRAAG